MKSSSSSNMNDPRIRDQQKRSMLSRKGVACLRLVIRQNNMFFSSHDGEPSTSNVTGCLLLWCRFTDDIKPSSPLRVIVIPTKTSSHSYLRSCPPRFLAIMITGAHR
mmetsp:Transcript_40015/g.96627  ORF Transcript_40015/g.96627 Transcript_40015/m.96627 type:complete len:107 (-) Transcript_40015:826-1146(-)